MDLKDRTDRYAREGEEIQGGSGIDRCIGPAADAGRDICDAWAFYR